MTFGGIRSLILSSRLVGDPVVDREPRLLRCIYEVQRPHTGPIALRQHIEERLKELIVLLAPERVDNVQPEPCFIPALCPSLARGELEVQVVERGMQPVLGKTEVEGIRHLALRLTPGSGVCHGEGQRDAVGREEQVPVFCGETLVHLEGEDAVPTG